MLPPVPAAGRQDQAGMARAGWPSASCQHGEDPACTAQCNYNSTRVLRLTGKLAQTCSGTVTTAVLKHGTIPSESGQESLPPSRWKPQHCHVGTPTMGCSGVQCPAPCRDLPEPWHCRQHNSPSPSSPFTTLLNQIPLPHCRVDVFTL